MNLTAILATIGAALIVGATAVAASGPTDRPVPVLVAAASHDVDATSSPPATEPEPATATTTTVARPRPTTTAAAPARAVGPLHLRCAGGTSGAWIQCAVKGVHERAAHLTLARDGATIARTGDARDTSFTDREVRPGQTYSYQAHSYTADGVLLQSSDAVRATAGPGDRRDHDRPLVLRCAGTPGPAVHCEWRGVPARTAHLTLTRNGVTITRTADLRMSAYDDHAVRPEATYAYEVHAYAADGTLLQSSGAVRATPGAGREDA